MELVDAMVIITVSGFVAMVICYWLYLKYELPKKKKD